MDIHIYLIEMISRDFVTYLLCLFVSVFRILQEQE